MGAILQLSKAGRELPEIERILPSAADIAALSDTGSIESATQILIGAQAAFQEFGEGIPATFENINVAADIIANTADATTASIESIQEGLANVGPIAAQYGLSFADVNAIIGTFADSNLRGAEAGTALKSALTNLNTDVAKRELARLGISLTDAQGNFRDFNDIILDLNGALNETQTIRISSLPGVDAANREQVEEAQRVLESATRQLFLWQNGLASGAGDPEKAADKVAEYNRQISAAQQLLTQLTGSQSTAQFITTEVTRSQQQNAESIRKLFGAYGQVAGSILLTNEGFGDLRDQILSSGTAAERAQLLLDNFRGDIEQLSGSVETLATKAFLPLVEKVFRPFVKLGRLVVDSILRMDDRVLEFISTAIAFGSILATVVGAGAILIGTLISIGGNFVLLALRLSSIFSVIGAVVGGLAALVTGLVVVTGVVAGLAVIVAGVTAAFEALRKIFTDDLGGARTAFLNFATLVRGAFVTLIETFSGIRQRRLGHHWRRGCGWAGKRWSFYRQFLQQLCTRRAYRGHSRNPERHARPVQHLRFGANTGSGHRSSRTTNAGWFGVGR